MDDEALARQLQAMEFQMAGRGMAEEEQGKASMLRSLEGGMQHVHEADDEMLQAMAVSLMPLDSLQEAARRTWLLDQGPDSNRGGLGEADYLMQGLLHWFKHTFFTWVDSPACDFCGGTTAAQGAVPPSQEEASHQASRTELFVCTTCGKQVRFPRFNSVGKLLETRRGRCGEWANTFLLCCRAAGFVARYIWDVNDHVWTEFWSDALQRWVHVDACEAAFDKPLLYEAGWGKQMSYVIALSNAGVADVTCRYTSKWEQVLLRRTRVPEQWLEQQCARMTAALRTGLPPHLALRCRVYDASEAQELAARRSGRTPSSDLQGLTARTTGSEAWRQERGEAGTTDTTATPPPAQHPTCTPWAALPVTIWQDSSGSKPNSPAMPVAVQSVQSLLQLVGRLEGGGCRAAGENGPAEASCRAFDGDVETKWLDFGGGGAGGGSWLEFKLEPGQAPITLAAYDLVSANDSPERDPKDWVLEGMPAHHPSNSQHNSQSNGQGDGWVVLDKQQGVTFTSRHELRTYWVTGRSGEPTGFRQLPCVAWRLRITSVREPQAANSVQLACLNLYAHTQAWATQAGPGGTVDAAQQLASQVLQPATTAAGDSSVQPPLPQLQLGLLTRMLANIAANPSDQRFRRVRAGKLSALWSHPPTLALLLGLGFRPLIMQASVPTPVNTASGAVALRGGGLLQAGDVLARDVFLVLEAGPGAVPRAAAAAAVLQAAT